MAKGFLFKLDGCYNCPFVDYFKHTMPPDENGFERTIRLPFCTHLDIEESTVIPIEKWRTEQLPNCPLPDLPENLNLPQINYLGDLL